ncbi:MAG: hypothetical protein EOO23_02190 [Comamonadaceae bacterium]|nr:MAG: hypothetical protein EOO23_02190 [Comamonadaceae bacterium]
MIGEAALRHHRRPKPLGQIGHSPTGCRHVPIQALQSGRLRLAKLFREMVAGAKMQPVAAAVSIQHA